MLQRVIAKLSILAINKFSFIFLFQGFLDLSTIETEGTLECFAINSIGEMQKPCSWTAVEIGLLLLFYLI